jgi:hypothetical protein
VVSVPAAAFAVLAAGNPTKLRISVFRDALQPLTNPTNPPNVVSVVAGHGIIKFQRLND